MKPGVLTLGAALLAFLILYGMTHPRQIIYANPPSTWRYDGPYTPVRVATMPTQTLATPKTSPRASVGMGDSSPTPRPSVRAAVDLRATVSVSGIASWYRYTAGEAAAGPALRRALGRGWRGSIVTVCASRCIRVRLSDWCLCGNGRVIDLDSRSFAQLAPLSRGLVRMTIRG